MASDFNEKIVRISGFRGVDQSLGDHNSDISTSPDASGFVCRQGILRTIRGTLGKYPALPERCAGVRQAFFRETGEFAEDRSSILAFGGGKVYRLNEDEDAWTKLGEGFSGDNWQGVNYRHEADDWFIMTNGSTPLKYWDGKSDALGDITPKQGGEPIVFEHLTLLYERLWGAVYASQPDRIYWSESFEPDNWELNYETPNTGGGFVDVATFDGTRIRAIVAAFDDVLIFKDKSMHRLNGTYPGEFNLTQVYGSEGTLAYGTIVTTADRLYFLGADGLCMYDGMTVSTMAHRGDRKLRSTWKRLNKNLISAARACIHDDVIYLSVALDEATENSHVIEYSLNDSSYSVHELPGITDWLVERSGISETLLCLIGNQLYRYDVGSSYCGQPIKASWLSPEITLGSLTTKKKVGRIYMTVNARPRVEGSTPSMQITLLSGGKMRSKIVPLKLGLNEVRKRIKIRGRSFRFKIENIDGASLTLPAGMEIALEEDSDV